MSRPRATAKAENLYCYAEAAADMGRLSELARAGGETRARLLAEFDVLNREVLTLGGGGVPRRLMAWEAMANELQREASAAATERGVVLVEQEELLEDFEWTLSEIEAAIAVDSRELILVHRDDSTVIYATPEGEQVAWVRQTHSADRWRWAEEDLTDGHGFTPRPANEPEAPVMSIRVLPPLEEEEEDVPGLEVAVEDPPSEEVQDLLEHLAIAGRVLREEAQEDGADAQAIEAEQERLAALLAHAGHDLDQLRALVRDAGETSLRFQIARSAREHAAEGGGEPRDAIPDPPSAAPDPDAPAAPDEKPAAPERVGPPVSGNEGGAETAPAFPPSLEDQREATYNLAVELGTEQGRANALAHVQSARTIEQLAAIRAEVERVLASERRIRESLKAHESAAQVEHAKRKTEQPAPKESALARKRREAREADQRSKDLPATKELRQRVVDLIHQVWPAPGTAPRDLLSAVEDAGFQALTKHHETLTKQAAAKAAKPPAPIARGESAPAVEGW